MPVKLISPGGGSVTLDVPSMANTYTLMLPTSNSGSIITTGVYPAAPGTSANVLTSNGTAFISQALAAVSPIATMNVFTSSGTFTIPTGVTKVRVTVVGAGGGAFNSSYPGGGGGGGTSIKVISGLVPGNTVSVTVGTAVAGGTGNPSSFGSYCSATGGAVSTSYYGGAGGIGSNGDLNFAGDSGGPGFNFGPCAGAGYGYIQGGGSFFGGGGGASTVTGRAYGGGAGTVANYAGGAGVVVVEY
jgi:hypothetical protein